MGSPKQTVKLAGRTMLDRVVDSFLSSRVSEVVVVVRKGVHLHSSDPRLKLVLNPHPEKGISESIKVGLTAADPQSDAVVIGLGDKPLLRRSTIDALISAYSSKKSAVVVPSFGGARGNPVLIDRSLFPEMLKLRGDSGAKIILKRHAADVLELRVDDEGVLLDVNTPDDARKVRGILARGKRLDGE